MSDPSPRSKRPASPNSPTRPKLRNQVLFVLGILMLAGGAFYTALIVATQIDTIFFPDSQIKLGGGLGKLPGIDAGSDSGDLGGDRINVLVMGMDRRPREGDAPTRTDTMFVMTIDPSTKTARGLGLPRDLYVDIPSKTGNSTFKERINTAYAIGETQKYSDGGAGLAKATVERLLKIKLDYYILIDLEGFKQVIDLIGGIDVDVTTEVNDPFYSETERPGDYYPCIFKPGTHHMDGSDALCYARVRRNSDDLDRIQRQQRIIFAVMDKASDLKILADPTNVVSLWKRYKDAVDTDISDVRIPYFARVANSMESDRLAFLTLGAAVTPFTTPEGAAVLLPSEAGVKQLVDALFSDQQLQQEAAMIEIQNGTDKQGQASKAVAYLASLGIPEAALTATNATNLNHLKSEIVDFGGKRYTSERIAAWLGLSKEQVRTATANDEALRKAGIDIVVILAADARVESTSLAGPTPAAR